MYSATEHFDAVDPVKEGMPQVVLQDLIRYIYFSKDWDDKMGVWGMEFLLFRQEGRSEYWGSSTPEEIKYTGGYLQCEITGHCKLRMLVDSNESRLAGWYHSVMTIGPEPILRA